MSASPGLFYIFIITCKVSGGVVRIFTDVTLLGQLTKDSERIKVLKDR